MRVTRTRIQFVLFLFCSHFNNNKHKNKNGRRCDSQTRAISDISIDQLVFGDETFVILKQMPKTNIDTLQLVAIENDSIDENMESCAKLNKYRSAQ